jgi:protein SCO1/2
MTSNEDQPLAHQRRNTRFIMIGGVLIGLLAGWLLLRVLEIWPFGPPQFHGTYFESPEPEPDFTLTAHTGERISLSDFRDHVTLLYFGYTYCPDICPTTLANLAQAKEKLGRAGNQVQVLMISVDPARDTAEALARYVTSFDSTFIGLTGTPEEIAAVASPMGIFYEKQEGTIETGYLVDHTASVLVIDKAGYLRLVFSLDTPSEDIAADLLYLARE